MTRAERRAHWRVIIENQATNGMCIAAYCRNSHIKPSNFYTWRRRLREQQPSAGGFLELISDRLAEATSGVRVHLGADPPGGTKMIIPMYILTGKQIARRIF